MARLLRQSEDSEDDLPPVKELLKQSSRTQYPTVSPQGAHTDRRVILRERSEVLRTVGGHEERPTWSEKGSLSGSVASTSLPPNQPAPEGKSRQHRALRAVQDNKRMWHDAQNLPEMADYPHPSRASTSAASETSGRNDTGAADEEAVESGRRFDIKAGQGPEHGDPRATLARCINPSKIKPGLEGMGKVFVPSSRVPGPSSGSTLSEWLLTSDGDSRDLIHS